MPSEEEVRAETERQAALAQQEAQNGRSELTTANDAAPRTLYVRRDVVNKAEITKWAKSQGFTDIVPDLHITITYSRAPVDWFKMGSTWDEEMTLPKGGARQMETFGEAKVLLVQSNMLQWRHEEMVGNGASFDFPEYQPHVTISYGAMPDNVEPYQGKIVLGPEIFEEVKE